MRPLMKKIIMETPLVEMDGDEMTRILWDMIKETLLLPYLELNTEYYDLGLGRRDETDDRITTDAALAIRKYGVGVKCATITPNTDRVKEFGLKKMWKSPNGTIRSILDGTVFRTPILTRNLKPFIPTWTRPIIIARHAYGDIYSDIEYRIERSGKVELVFTGDDNRETRQTVHHFKDKGIVLGMHNLDESITGFARSCFNYALDRKINLWFSAKDTISKTYDGVFRDVFRELYEMEYKESFRAAGIEYFYTLIDDAVARLIRSEGGMLWACKNYDGDVMSDMVAAAFGSLAMMTSVLVSPKGYYEYEAAHGTVQRHYSLYLKGEKTSTNPMATLFAWTGALKKRGGLDGNDQLATFAGKLEQSAIEVIEDGIITKDLNDLCSTPGKTMVGTEEFLNRICERLDRKLIKG